MTLRCLVLLRHGRTDYNASGRMQGHLDPHLTPDGHGQAAAVAPEVARFAPTRLLSSDLQRAADTADVIGEACGLAVKLDPRLRETHLGDWQGQTVTEIEAGWPGAVARWRSDPGWAPPGGESRVEAVARSRPVIDELDAEGDVQTALVVAHGGLIGGLVSGLLELPTSSWPAIGGVGNCRWAVLARRAGNLRWRMSGYNLGLAP